MKGLVFTTFYPHCVTTCGENFLDVEVVGAAERKTGKSLPEGLGKFEESPERYVSCKPRADGAAGVIRGAARLGENRDDPSACSRRREGACPF